MNTQINIRLSENMITSAKSYASKHGFGTIQDFIKETIREKLFPDITKKELDLVKQLVKVSEKKNLYGIEAELFKKLRR